LWCGSPRFLSIGIRAFCPGMIVFFWYLVKGCRAWWDVGLESHIGSMGGVEFVRL